MILKSLTIVYKERKYCKFKLIYDFNVSKLLVLLHQTHSKHIEMTYLCTIYIGQMLDVTITTRGHQRCLVDLKVH